MTALVIAEHDNASIKGATLNTVTAAAQCGGDVHVLVAGHNAGAAAAAAAQIAGVAKVIHVESEGLAHGLAENMTAQIVAIAGNYSHLVFPATASGKNMAPRVAAKLDVAQMSDVTKVISPDTFERPIYAGNAIATVQSTDATKVLTVRTTGFDPAAATGGGAAVKTGTGSQHNVSFLGSRLPRTTVLNSRQPRSSSPVAALWAPAKFMEVMTPMADKLGAAMGLPWRWMQATHRMTGRWVRPAKIVAPSCISPAVSAVRSSIWPA